jgi:thiol-disulfide isomerase/thioredoxin
MMYATHLATVRGVSGLLLVAALLGAGCQPAAMPAKTVAALPPAPPPAPVAVVLPPVVPVTEVVAPPVAPAAIETEPAQPAESPVQEPEPQPAATEAAPVNAADPPADAAAADATVEPTAVDDAVLAPAVADGADAPPLKMADPFPRKLTNVPDFPGNMQWLNTSKPLTKADLKGKFVLLDFWTYCCINCMHILPELKKLEKEFPNQLVVIGVHSAKFDTEKVADNIREAMLRHEIEHPVVNDAEHGIWDSFGVSSWPTILMLDPEGNAVWGRSGEFKAAQVREILNAAIPFYRAKKLLNEKPFPLIKLEAAREDSTPLRFPGKILADEASERLFITDSNHNRIVIANLEGKLLDIIGSGTIGRNDGNFRTASFDHPQGCALHGETLYVADTENHLLRKVDLQAKTVTTIAGTGVQAKHSWPGLEAFEAAGPGAKPPVRWIGPPAGTALNSPWALWVHKNDLYIAMAGPHQIWKMPLDEKEIGPYAGNGREDIVDGPLIPRVPYMMGFSSFAQPSGLSSDGTWLYVADSEGSSIRAVPFQATRHVKTVLGSDGRDNGRLFDFGDVDGPRSKAKLQHCLEVVYLNGKLYVADTYNHKIKVVDAKNGDTKTLAGTGKAGSSDEPAQFHEPAGLAHAKGVLYVADTNNHLIRTIDLATGKVATLAIAGLTPPGGAAVAKPVSVPAALAATAIAAPVPKKPAFKGAAQEKLKPVTVQPVDGKLRLAVSLKVPAGWKMNPDAPMSYWVDSTKESGPVERASFGRTKLAKPVSDFEFSVPTATLGEDEVAVSFSYYYCEDRPDGVCKVGSVVFTVPLTIAAEGSTEPVLLVHSIGK